MEEYKKTNELLCESTHKILASGRFTVPSTQELLLSSIISFASNDAQIAMIYKWFMEDKVTNVSGKEELKVDISTKTKHRMVEKIYSYKGME